MSLEGEGPSLRALLEREHDCCARLAPILEAERAAAAAIGNQARDADERATIEENVAGTARVKSLTELVQLLSALQAALAASSRHLQTSILDFVRR